MSNSLQVKRFVADNIQTALTMVKKEIGSDAVILSSEEIDGKIHVIAAPETAVSHENTNVAHAQQTASALTKLKQSKSPDNVNPYFFNPATKNDERFSSVAMQSKQSHQSKHSSVHIEDMAISKLSAELSSIKKMMTSHFFSQSWEQFQQENLIQAILYKKLIAIGFEASTIEPYISKLSNDVSFDEAWISVLNDIVKNIKLYSPAKQKKAINVLLGPAGCGKTTLLAKYLMSQTSSIDPQQAAIIFVSQDKLTTVHEAKSFKNVFNLPCYYVETVEELEKALSLCEDKQQVFIDLPAPNMLSPEENIYINYLEMHQLNTQVFYVLPSNINTQYVSNLKHITKDLPIAALSVTKIDEHANYIPLVDCALRYDIPIAFLNLSSSMTESLIPAQATAIIKDMLIVINQFSLNEITIDEKMANHFMEKINNASEPTRKASNS